MEADLLPLSQLIPEFLLALGGAFLLGNLAAYVRLRPAWKEAKRAGRSRASADAKTSASGRPPAAAKAPAGGKAAGTSKTSGGARGAGGKAPPLPSRTRVLANMVVGLLVTAASLAALIARG